MSKVDWSKAPGGAEFYAHGGFWKKGGVYALFYENEACAFVNAGALMRSVVPTDDYEPRPSHITESSEITQYDESSITASAFLKKGLEILEQRGKQYNPSGKKERSFKQVAEAFNAITGKELKGSDVCLMLAVLKLVRQNASSEFHEDSAIDGINYLALYAEELLGEQK